VAGRNRPRTQEGSEALFLQVRSIGAMLLRTPHIEPCLPSPTERPPSGPNWVDEIKHDGYRLMARRDAVPSNGTDEGIPVGNHRQAHGVQARHRGCQKPGGD
jgi:hypothetical protein